jgi:hypothetical protein
MQPRGRGPFHGSGGWTLSIEKPGRQNGLKKAIFGLNSQYLGDGQTRDGLSWSTWQFKRGTLLSGQTKEWRIASNLPVDLSGVEDVHRCISPWLATPRSLLAANEVVKKKNGVCECWSYPIDLNLLSMAGLPWVPSDAAARRSCVHDEST